MVPACYLKLGTAPGMVDRATQHNHVVRQARNGRDSANPLLKLGSWNSRALRFTFLYDTGM
jgi:hypothetical protein